MPDHPRASQIADTFLNGNRTDARNAVLADPRPDLMALDVLTDLLDRNWELQYDSYNDVVDSWRRCLAGGL